MSDKVVLLESSMGEEVAQQPVSLLPIDPSDEPKSEVKRELQFRHLVMLALGGCIGTGLFIASGSAIRASGPGSSVLAFVIIGLLVYFLMASLGEMTSYFSALGPFSDLPSRFVDKAFGFAMSWNFFLCLAICIPVQMHAIGFLSGFWIVDSDKYIKLVHIGALLLIFIFNLFPVKNFGEIEYWIAIIKIIVIAIFLLVGLLEIIGLFGNAKFQFNNFSYKDAPFVNGFQGVCGALLIGCFSFAGTEYVAVSAAESANPEKTVPRAVKTISWILISFYILTFLIISLIFKYDDKAFVEISNASSKGNVLNSPFTIIFQDLFKAGGRLIPSIVNAVIISAVFSAANGCLYCSSRHVFSMAQIGFAPKIFAKLTKTQVPFFALCFATIIPLGLYLFSLCSDTAFGYLFNAVTLADIIHWICISITHFRFRRAFVRSTTKVTVDALHYKAPLYPFADFFIIIICVFVIIFQDIKHFRSGEYQILIIEYLTIPFFLIMFSCYKFFKKTKLVKLSDVNLNSDQEIKKEEIKEENEEGGRGSILESSLL